MEFFLSPFTSLVVTVVRYYLLNANFELHS